MSTMSTMPTMAAVPAVPATSTIQSDRPRLANVERRSNKSYYPIGGLLKELDMHDKQEQHQFRAFLKEYLGWDEETKQGYTRQEHIAIPDSHMRCYATQFLDNAAIEPEERLAESKESMAGPYYFPGPLDIGPNFSPHAKKWTYAQHRDGLIEVVAAIMVTQKRNLRDDAQQPRAKGKRAGLTRPESSRKRRAPMSQRRSFTFSFSDSDTGSSSDESNIAPNARTASPPHESVQHRASGSVPCPSTASSGISNSCQPLVPHENPTLGPQSAPSGISNSCQPLAPHDNPSLSPQVAPSGTSPAKSPTPSAEVKSASSQRSASFIQPTTEARQSSSTDVSHAIHPPYPNLSTSPASSVMPGTSATSASEAEVMGLISKIEGLQYARRLCMEVHCSQQITARSVDGPAKQHLIAKADGVLDMLVGLDRALKQDQAKLRRLVGA